MRRTKHENTHLKIFSLNLKLEATEIMSLKLKVTYSVHDFARLIWVLSLSIAISFRLIHLWRFGDSVDTQTPIQLLSNDTIRALSAKNHKTDPIIFGEDRYCGLEHELKYMDVSGMYNTGTNALFRLLSTNCFGSDMKFTDLFPNNASPRTKSGMHEFIRYQKQHGLKLLEFPRTYWSVLSATHRSDCPCLITLYTHSQVTKHRKTSYEAITG